MLGQGENKAVVAMTVFDSSGKGLDTYLHFKKDTIWKMSAFRALALTGLIEQVKVELEKMTQQRIDNVIAKSNKRKKGNIVMFTSRDDYEFQLGNARLTLELDENIAKHFQSNQKEFERLKDLALQDIEKEKSNAGSIKLIEDLKMEYRKLFIYSVSTGEPELGNCVNFLIGGLMDNSVGYIYVGDKKNLPEMNSGGVIMIRELGNGWYIYKTT